MSKRSLGLRLALLALSFASCSRNFHEEHSADPVPPDAPRSTASADGGRDSALEASTRDASVAAQPGAGTSPSSSSEPPPEPSTSAEEGSGRGVQNWSKSFAAVYDFEAASLGRDSSGHDNDLEVEGEPAPDNDGVRGNYSARFEQSTPEAPQYLRTTREFGRTPSSPSITIGAWVRSGNNGEYELFSNGDELHGGFSAFVKLVPRSFRCSISGGLSKFASFGGEQVADFSNWHHVACRYDDDTKLAQYFVDGVGLPPEHDAPDGLAEGSGEFRVALGFKGQLDEVFFIKRALTDAQLARIYACGVDGKACSCSETKPAEYETCGPLGTCSPLPACNSDLAP